MPKVNAALAGFSELNTITTIVPTFEGASFPVSFSIVAGDFGINNANYTIDLNGGIRVLVKPTEPIQNFVRYRITADHDPCAWVEDFLQIYWIAEDFKPIVNKYVENASSIYLSLNSNLLEVAFVDNPEEMPSGVIYNLQASYLNSNPSFVSSLFDMDSSGRITVKDINNIVEDILYEFIVKVTDPNTMANYSTNICLGPFKLDTPLYGAVVSAEECSALAITTTLADGFNPTYDCALLQPSYPSALTAQELTYYETNCLDSEIIPPVFAILYEPLTTEFFEARSYTVSMSGLESDINQPQTITFNEGETNVIFDLVGNIKTISAFRTETDLTVTFITRKNDVIITTNLNYREGLTDPLATTFVSAQFQGYTEPLTYAITSNQTLAFSDDHGLYIRNNNACYGRIGAALGVDPDIYLAPNGGDFENPTDCLGG